VFLFDADLQFADLDVNTDGKVSAEELADCYRRSGLGGVLVGIGKPTATDQLTDALVKSIDTNKDGKVEEAEWKAAGESLRKLDKNDDELIGPGELVERTSYPGALGSILFAAPSPDAKPDSATDALPLIVLPIRTTDAHWIATVTARRANESKPVISVEALADLRKAPPATAWHIRLATLKKGDLPLEVVGGKPPTNARLSFSSPGIRLELRTDDGRLKGLMTTASKRFLAQFAESDSNSDETVDDKELVAPKAGMFKQLLATADRDADGKLSISEFKAWLDLQEQIARGHVLLTILDHGAGLFELLDVDHDGSLSVRELRTVWDRLKAAECVTEKNFDRKKLPRQFLAAVSHGHPQTIIGKPMPRGPDWFRAMDRNGDGDVSRREFTGPADVFDKLDTKKDGLLDAEEAARAAAK